MASWSRINGGFVWQFVAMFAMIFSAMAGVVPSLQAQSGSSDIAIVTSHNGNPFYSACFVLVNYSQEGCDVNGDGDITFDDIPYGTYTLRQTRDLGSGLYVADTTIQVTGAADWDGRERFYVSVQGGGGAATSDIAVVTSLNGASYYNACFVLVDYSLEGCDVNGDGDITFDDIPYGTYTLRQTRDLGSGLYVADTTIQVTGAADWDGRERFYVSVAQSEPPVDVTLITRDPADGGLLTDTCYVLVGYSNEGCDENGDGQVTFDAIPPGTYTVRQTKTPEGYPTINEFEINVANIENIPIGFVVRQAPEQNEPGTRNVSVIFFDDVTNEKIVTDICVEFVGASNVGCDEDLRDGQIDFVDLPVGEWYLDFTNVPDGWAIAPVGGQNAPVLIMDTDEYPANHFIFVPVSVGTSASSASAGSATVSSGQMRPMSITATICPPPGGNQGECEWAIGVRFNVTDPGGGFIGSCVLEGDPHSTMQIAGNEQCVVEIPDGVMVTVTVDASTIPAGYEPVENPLYFTWPRMVPSYVGVGFSLVPE